MQKPGSRGGRAWDSALAMPSTASACRCAPRHRPPRWAVAHGTKSTTHEGQRHRWHSPVDAHSKVAHETSHTSRKVAHESFAHCGGNKKPPGQISAGEHRPAL